MKRLAVFGWDASPLHGYPRVEFAATHLYTLDKRGTARVKCLAQEHKQCPWSGVKLSLLSPESRAQSNQEAIAPPYYSTA